MLQQVSAAGSAGLGSRITYSHGGDWCWLQAGCSAELPTGHLHETSSPVSTPPDFFLQKCVEFSKLPMTPPSIPRFLHSGFISCLLNSPLLSCFCKSAFQGSLLKLQKCAQVFQQKFIFLFVKPTRQEERTRHATQRTTDTQRGADAQRGAETGERHDGGHCPPVTTLYLCLWPNLMSE